MHYCGAKVQRNYNCYNVYFKECLPCNPAFCFQIAGLYGPHRRRIAQRSSRTPPLWAHPQVARRAWLEGDVSVRPEVGRLKYEYKQSILMKSMKREILMATMIAVMLCTSSDLKAQDERTAELMPVIACCSYFNISSVQIQYWIHFKKSVLFSALPWLRN